MYLKKMEIVGFKSFADRTKIAFDQGITAIVGPNGSGKSNIVEGLRWVLGEQSAKSLRGGKMPDVIFSGTAKRHALNYAEVIATFDNSDDYLLGHDEDDEVVITRRLYRNGDSDYLINGRKSRLKDITELFTDTGLGRDSLSIISQGRIESVFNSKAEERRAIFEEAAGVLKFKNRKAETESKLASTQDNLDRLEDIIFELNGQLTPLRAQREVALKFQELDGQRAKLALSVLVAQLTQEKAKYDAAQADLQELLSNLTELSSQQKIYENDLAELKSRRIAVEAQQEEMQASSLKLTELKAELQRKLAVFDVQKSSSEKSAQERAARRAELDTRLSNLTEQLTEAEAQLSNLTAQKAELEQEITDLAAELAHFAESPETAAERLRDAYLALVNQEAELSNQLTRNKAEAEALRTRLAAEDESAQENAAKLAEVSDELAQAQTELSALSATIKQLLTDYQAQTQNEQALAKTEKSAQDAMFAQMDALKNQKARLASLEAIRDNHSNLYQGVRAVMQQGAQLPGIIGVVADLLNFEAKYTTALDIALGGGSQNIIVEDEAAARRAIAYLRDNRLGRATFLPLTTMKARDFRQYAQVSGMPGFIDTALNLVQFDARLTNALSNLLGATVVVDTSEHATAIARALHYSVRIVTLDGTQLNPGGSYAGGAGKRNTTTFTTSQIAALQQEIAQAENKLKLAEQQVQSAQKAHLTASEALEQLRVQGEEKRFDEKTLQLKIEQLQAQKAELSALSNLTESEQGNLTLSNLTENKQKISAELAHIAKQKTELDAQLATVKSNSQAYNDLKNAKNQAYNEAKIALSKISSEQNFVKSDRNRLRQEIADLSAEQAKLADLSAEPSINEADRRLIADQLAQTEQKLQDSSVKLVSLRFERDDLSAQMDDLEAHNHEFIARNQELNTQKTRLEMQIEQSENYLRSRQNTLSTDYEMSFDEAQSQAEILSNLTESENELRKFDRQIRALGPVNLEAISQFDEVNARYDFLTSQKADLTEAKNLLLSTIDDMNDEVKVRFKSTFDAIRSSFQLTFSQMFSGGTADLELTSDDLLSAGVEINVQPPGKKLASLNLMSGGEKALTALALIFAILRVRTVPFVVLDEVEAALDEANVKRFGDYMNHFDNSNQFIVVTHRRGTMAAAGAMYGVTMADAGVSKVLSIRLEQQS